METSSTDRLYVATFMFGNRSQMTSRCSKSKSGYEVQPSLTLMVLPHFDLICDLLCYTTTPKWNLYALSNAVFSLILSKTSKINFQTSKAILLSVEFSRIRSNFKQ